VELLSYGLKHWLRTWWEGRANPGELRCVQCPWVSGRVESGSTPSQTSFKGWQWRWGYFLLDISAYLRPSKGKQLLSFISASRLVLVYCSQKLCHPAIIMVLSIPLYPIACIQISILTSTMSLACVGAWFRVPVFLLLGPPITARLQQFCNYLGGCTIALQHTCFHLTLLLFMS